MKLIALLLLAQAVTSPAPTSKSLWRGENPNGKVLNPMYIEPSEELFIRIREKQATFAEVDAMFRQSRPEEYRDAFFASPEVTVIATENRVNRLPSPNKSFQQLLASKKGGVTDYWFLVERNGRDGCMVVVYHVSSNGGRGDLERADKAAGPADNALFGVIHMPWARMCGVQ